MSSRDPLIAAKFARRARAMWLRLTSDGEPLAEHRIVLGTHHKTGTVLVGNVFRQLARDLGLNYFSGEQADLPQDWQVFMQAHSRIEVDRLGDNWRGLHVIRDPRDNIISGCHYHLRSSERWLHEPREELNGQTYQEAIKACPSLDEAMIFEITHAGGHRIRAMAAWDYDNPSFYEARLEDLVTDESLSHYSEIFRFLGVSERALPVALAVARHNSLFAGAGQRSQHVRSGAPQEWVRGFSPRVAEVFIEHLGDALIKLGYEPDHAWVQRLAPKGGGE